MNSAISKPVRVGAFDFAPARRDIFRVELGIIMVVLLLLNAPLLQGVCNTAMVFIPDRVQNGEWWRLLTHAFVHVTWYHLLLDGAAFLLMYHSLRNDSPLRRIVCTVAGIAGSLLVSLWANPGIFTRGLCGLSGVAHGLMAISALDMMKSAPDKRAFYSGLAGWILIIAKGSFEAFSGEVMFSFLHFGLMGSPVAVSHAGGILGALLAFALFDRLGGFSTRRRNSSDCQK